MLAAPAHAGTERASIAVSLRVLPSCTARAKPAAPETAPPTLECSGKRVQTRSSRTFEPAYAVRTYRSAAGTVVSYDF